MKRRGCLAGLLIAIVVIGAAAAAIAVFLPGFFRPKDLDVEISQKAFESAAAKLEYSKVIDTVLSGEELSSFVNYGLSDSYGMKKAQIRINTDDTLEISSALDTDYFLNDVLGGKYSREDIKKAMPAIGLLPKSINIYARVGFEVHNDQTSNLTVDGIQVMGVGVPEDIYTKANNEIGYILSDFIKKMEQKTGAEYDSVSIRDGRLLIKGGTAEEK